MPRQKKLVRESFSDQLRRLMVESGQSRYRIWKETGIPQPTLSRFARGRAGLSFGAIEKLVQFLDLQLIRRGS